MVELDRCHQRPQQQPAAKATVARRRTGGGISRGTSTTISTSDGTKHFGDPEMKRKRRVATYKMYAVEGKVKESVKRGFRWLKDKCYELTHAC